MSTKFTTVRLTLNGEHFEILVNPESALEYKQGRRMEVSQVVAVDEVYSDASKGLRVSTEKLMKHFSTGDTAKVIEEVLKRGELQLTTEQRRRLIEEKRKQIINIVTRNYVDPKTGLPHPPLRIEQAIQQVRVSIDPFRDAGEQAKLVVEQLRAILPLKSEKVRLVIQIPPQHAPRAIGVLKSFAELQKEEWGADGTLSVQIEIPAGLRFTLMEKLGSATKGTAQASIMR